MDYRALGDSGLTVSTVGLGSGNFGRQVDQKAADDLVSLSLDAGINLFDTAEAYGEAGESEAILGRALRGRRDDIVLATKFGHPDHAGSDAPGSRANLRRAVEGSLRRLQTDHIDLLYLHFPDPRTPVDETLAAMGELVAEGKVRHLGACNLTATQFVEARHTARDIGAPPYIACQNLYNLIEREAGNALLPACRTEGAAFLPFSPLAKGLLTGRYRRDEPVPEGRRLSSHAHKLRNEMFDEVDHLAAFAQARGLSLLQVALGGLLAEPGVTSILIGASSPQQMLANIAAAEWKPDSDEMAAIDAICRSRG